MCRPGQWLGSSTRPGPFSLLDLLVTMKKSVLGLSLSVAPLPPGQMNSLPLRAGPD